MGSRLTIKDSLVDVVVYDGKLMCFVMFVRDSRMGVDRIIKVIKMEDVIMFITFIWSCTKFLVPKTNGLLLSYKSKKAIFLCMVA